MRSAEVTGTLTTVLPAVKERFLASAPSRFADTIEVGLPADLLGIRSRPDHAPTPRADDQPLLRDLDRDVLRRSRVFAFHTRDSSGQAKIRIDEVGVIESALQTRQLRLVLDWAELHQGELLENWQRRERVRHFWTSSRSDDWTDLGYHRRVGRAPWRSSPPRCRRHRRRAL
jgi:hypothetical protein